MADPLSVAGVVLGVISLGLQVAGGLSDYLDAVGGRTEELNSAKQQVAEMRDLLLTIKDLLPQVQRDWPAPATLVERRVKSCDVELSALHALLSELSQQASSDSGIRLKLAEQKKKLIYPFNRTHISRLEKRLIRVNSALQTALQVAELNISIASANDIRQVRDLVLTMSQLQVMRTQSTSLTAAHAIPQQTVDSGALGQLDSVNIATSSTSKSPSFLYNSTGILENCNTAETAGGSLSRVCSCPQFRKASYNRHSWGSFLLSYGSSDIMKHLPGCPFSNIDSGTQATKFTVAYIGRSRFFQTAVILSLLSTRSAGGRSISPSLTYYPTVDRWTAPAFRILRLVTEMFNYEPGNWESEEAIKTLRCCFNSIVTLFCRKQASPKDIDIYGRSLMHLVARMFDVDYGYMQLPGADVMATIIANLVACGVPLTTCDRDGFTPSGILIHALYQNKALEGLLKHFVPEDSDIPLFVRPGLILASVSYPCLLLRNIKVAEASGCGPLSLAAMAGNEGLVRGLLKQDPRALEEVNQFGHTPLHCAINHPSCLRLILDAGGSSMLKTQDVFGYTPLSSASISGNDTSTQILLASGSFATLDALAEADESCINSLLSSLKQCRDGLKMLALENLTKAETEFFGLHESKVLDDNAWEVEKLLLSRGVYIPPQLKTWPTRVTWSPIYRIYRPRKKQLLVFDKLWALGFRAFVNSYSVGRMPLLEVSDIMAVRWLIEHGANYWGPLSEESNITASITTAHFHLAHIGRDLYLEDSFTDTDSETLQWVIEKLMQVRISDTCFSCPCFLGGCTPFKAFFDWARNYTPRPRCLAQWWVSSVRIFQTYLNEENIMASLRRITFDALEILHTCCDFDRIHYKKTLITPEDANEINSEQDTLLTLFADLLTELRDIAYEDRCGTPLIVSDPEEFWMNRWLPRITEVLDSLNGDNLTAEERSAAEAAGVIWGPQPVRMEVTPEYEWYSPEYVMKKLDKIMNECTIG